jgi:integrase
MEKNVQLKYRLYRWHNGIFYWQDNGAKKQGTFRTTDKREAERLLHAMNESHREPTLNLNLARAYLAEHDPKMANRTWQAVMDEMATHGIPTTQERCARRFRSKAYDPIRNKPLVQTTGADLLAIIHTNGNCVAHYLRRLHNLAVDHGWLPWPILAKRAWPKIRSRSKRAITAEEHGAVIASEKNPERHAYYELLYETGAAQTDAANLTAENIDWQNGVLVYHRKKLGPFNEPCRLTIGRKLRSLLNDLPPLRRFVSEHQKNFCESSISRISQTLPSCRRYRNQLAFIPPCLGATSKGLRISAAICAGSIGPH